MWSTQLSADYATSLLRRAVKGFTVPIRPLLTAHAGVFSPTELKAITDAFDGILKDLNLRDRDDPVVMMMAKLTIELAKGGDFTAAELRARVIQEMKPKAL